MWTRAMRHIKRVSHFHLISFYFRNARLFMDAQFLSTDCNEKRSYGIYADTVGKFAATPTRRTVDPKLLSTSGQMAVP
jgi:hypothetical protein